MSEQSRIMAKHRTFDSESEGEYGEDDLELFSSLGKMNEKEKVKEQKNPDEDLLASEGSDSDEAPDDIGFTSSRQAALKDIQEKLSQIRSDQAKQKESRKKREELFRDQKKKRLKALESQRLPDDFLKDLADEPVKKKSKQKTEETIDEQPGISDTEDIPDQDDVELEKDIDYIPIESAGIEVLPVKNIQKRAQSSSEKAKDFRQQMLYGSRVKRVTTEDFICTKKKKQFLAKR